LLWMTAVRGPATTVRKRETVELPALDRVSGSGVNILDETQPPWMPQARKMSPVSSGSVSAHPLTCTNPGQRGAEIENQLQGGGAH
jgi:hypothetical protein